MAYVKCLMNVVSSTIPDGKTVTPTDDVSILLACAGRTETYTTISALLDDATALAGVISSNNAIDYLVRSTTFASDVCADQGAMADIGADNYASNTLLANSTWRTAICGSTYFESVLNVKVPIMKSNNTPSGLCVCSDAISGYEAYKAFDRIDSSVWNSLTSGSGKWLGYKFTEPIKVHKIGIKNRSITYGAKTIQPRYSDTGSSYTNVGSQLIVPANTNFNYFTLSEIAEGLYWTIYISNSYNGGVNDIQVCELQFYGRADI